MAEAAASAPGPPDPGARPAHRLRIYLVRHGQSLWQLRPGADLDMSLSPLGHEQAEHLGTWCAKHDLLDARSRLEFGSLRTSPLKRAQETAGHVAAALHLPAHIQPTLTEAPFHVAGELPSADRPFAPQVGEVSERYRVFRRQVRAGLAELVRLADGSDLPVLAVTHGGVIKTVLRTIAGTDAFCARLYNCGITAIEWKDGRWRVVHVNLWDHLPPGLRTT